MALRYLFPGGKQKALTLSYDDGVKQDVRLVGIFNHFGLKGTFHLNSATFGGPSKVSAEEVATLYAGHEVSCHTSTHPFLNNLPVMQAMTEVWEDRKRLEELCGYPVIGMSYPYGTSNPQVVDILRNAGIVYSRTTVSTHNFFLPADYLMWNPTCHHREMLEMAPQFLDARYPYSVFYVWGHSYEFDRNDNWKDMETFAEMVAHREEVWYATNIEIYRYDMAVKGMVVSTNGKMLYNPSGVTVCFSWDNQVMTIGPGESKTL